MSQSAASIFQVDAASRQLKKLLSWAQKPEGVALLCILAAALFFRLWGAFFGLPYLYHADEPFEVYRAVRLGLGGFDFERWAKGGYYLILFVEFGIYFVFSFITGAISSVSDFAQSFVDDASPFWRIGRVTTATIGMLTVLLVWWQGRQIAGPMAGLLAAIFIALSYEHAMSSHYITVDVPATFFAFWAITMIVEDIEGRRSLKFYEFGPVSAFAVMCKLPMVLLFIPYFMARYMKGGVRGDGGLITWQTWTPLFTAGLFYLVLNPGAIVFADEVVRFFLETIGLASPIESQGEDVYAGLERGVNLWNYYLAALIDSQGLPLLVVSVLGAVAALVFYRRPMVLHFTFAAALYVAISGSATNNLYYDRYVIPMLPALCLAAGIGLSLLFAQPTKRFSLGPVVVGAAAGVTALALVAIPASAIIEFDRFMTRENPRTSTLRWVEENVPSGSRILVQGNPDADASLMVPLRNSRENIEKIIQDLNQTDPGKAMFWSLRLNNHREPAFDMVTKRHFEVWGSLVEHRSNGIDYAIVRRGEFAPNRGYDPRRKQEWLDSRRSFYQELQADEDARLVAEFYDADRFKLAWHIEVWKLN